MKNANRSVLILGAAFIATRCCSMTPLVISVTSLWFFEQELPIRFRTYPTKFLRQCALKRYN